MRHCSCPHLLQFSPSRLFPEGVAYAVRPHRSYGLVPFRTSNVIQSVRSSNLWSSSEIVRPSSARVSAHSLICSPRCHFTFIRKVALPARTHCGVSRQIISRRMSASGAVANIAFPPCPTHFLITRKTASLSHSRRASSLRAADCSANTKKGGRWARPRNAGGVWEGTYNSKP